MDGGVLGAEIEGGEFGGVGDAEDVADVEGGVYAMDVLECFRSPDIDDRVAGATNEQTFVLGEDQSEDTAGVTFQISYVIVCVEGEDHDLAALGAGIDVVRRHGDSEDATATVNAMEGSLFIGIDDGD